MNHKLQCFLVRSRLGRTFLWFVVIIRTKGKVIGYSLKHIML